jgi:hypothetical protein
MALLDVSVAGVPVTALVVVLLVALLAPHPAMLRTTTGSRAHPIIRRRGHDAPTRERAARVSARCRRCGVCEPVNRSLAINLGVRLDLSESVRADRACRVRPGGDRANEPAIR